MFVATLFTKLKWWAKKRYTSADEWINKIWCIHKVEYYTAFEKNEILIHG